MAYLTCWKCVFFHAVTASCSNTVVLNLIKISRNFEFILLERISDSNSSSEYIHVLKISSTYGNEKGHFD